MTRPSAFAAPVVVGMMFCPRDASTSRDFVRDVQHPLIVRVAVNRVHQAVLDPDEVVEDLGRRRQAVRRARRVLDHVMQVRVVPVLVDAQDDREVRVLRWRADDDLAGPTLEVGRRLIPALAAARHLENDVDTQVAPGQVASGPPRAGP